MSVALSAGSCTTIRAIDKKNGSVPVEVLRIAATRSRILKGISVAINIIDKKRTDSIELCFGTDVYATDTDTRALFCEFILLIHVFLENV